MRILFFYESMNLGGQQTQTYNVIKRMHTRGHILYWAYLFGSGIEKLVSPYATLEQIPVMLGSKDYFFRPWKLFIIINHLLKYCRSNKIDTIISGSGIGSIISGLAARLLRVRHYRLVGCSMIQVEKTLYRYYQMFRVDSLVDGYFGWPGVFEELASKGVPQDKFYELNNAVDTEMFHPFPLQERLSIRESLGIYPDEIVLGWIGRISVNMQIGNTVELAKVLKSRGFDKFKLLIVGGGPWSDKLRELANSYGLREHLIFTEWVPPGEVNTFVNAMDVVPLLESDPHGGSIVREAMACGRVALSVDGASGTQRRFMHPDATILVSPKSFIEEAATAVIQLFHQKDMFESLGRNARHYAETEMSFDRQVDTILQVIYPRSV